MLPFPHEIQQVRSTEDEDSPERATAVETRPVRERAAERCSQTMAVDLGFFDGLETQKISVSEGIKS